MPLAGSWEQLQDVPAVLVDAKLILEAARADARETSDLEREAEQKNSSVAQLMRRGNR